MIEVSVEWRRLAPSFTRFFSLSLFLSHKIKIKRRFQFHEEEEEKKERHLVNTRNWAETGRK
jgi:hypothetical protein